MQGYIGYLAILWIGFNILAVFSLLKWCKSDLEVVDLPEFFLAFWTMPARMVNIYFNWNLPLWLGALSWFVPLYAYVIYHYSIFVNVDTGWLFGIGRLAFMWAR